MSKRSTRLIAAVMSVVVLASMAAVPADARRGGSFGSRGSRTYSAPRSSYGYVPPVQRSMTSRPVGQVSPTYAPGYAQPSAFRPSGSHFGGFGGGLLTGLVAGGLLGHFFGHGAGNGWGGGGAGLLASLIQLAIVGGIVWLVIGFFRRRSGYTQPPMAGGFDQPSGFMRDAGSGPWGGAPVTSQGYAEATSDIAITPADQQAFERLLVDVQDAFGREDYARLRQLTTPEIMSYLSEELSQNATQGMRNEVRNIRLVDAEVSEAWREASGDYATIIMRYEGIDLMRDRATGTIVSGSAVTPSETVELWTFVRDACGVWKLSAIQES